ncbi:MAG: hypothetical protein LBR79_02710 [Oscillospiraceae bacterium]|nr:hypothetical protein [Oscillospiraceae bacterium]
MVISSYPAHGGGEEKVSTILRHDPNYSCYDLKQSSKVNLSVYFLPAVGREKVIKIKRFSNETAIVDNIFPPPPTAGGKKKFQLF